jgi:hypothetical protein
MAHHLILLSPVLALLAAYGGTKISSLDIWPSNISQFWPSRFSNVQIDRPKVVAAVMGVVLFITTLNVAIISSVVFLEPKPRENPTYLAAEILEIITTPNDLVISGDPEIALLAGRNVPPELVDTAENRYPHLTDEYLVNRTLENNITAVVVAYIMIDFIEYIEFLDAHYTRDLRAWDIDPAILQDLEDQDVLIYVKPDFSRVL